MSDLNGLSATQSISQTLDTIEKKYNLQDLDLAENLVERCLMCLCLKYLSQSELLQGRSEAFHNVQVSFVLQSSQNGYINDNR